jgi:hypothetical protein
MLNLGLDQLGFPGYNMASGYTVLRARIIFLKYVHPAKRARAQKLYIVSSYTYAFDETFTCVWIIIWCISLEWHEAHLDDGFTQTIPPASSLIFK